MRRGLRLAPFGLGAALAVVAPAAAPSSPILPAPSGVVLYAVSAAVLVAAFAIGARWPTASLFGLVALVVLEGAVRKWIVNDVTVFLAKDFLLLGIYARVLPALTRGDVRRLPVWAIAPLALLLALAVAYVPSAGSLSEGLIGLRAYALYAPLLLVVPRLLDSPRRLDALLVAVVSLGTLNAVLGAAQAITAGEWINESAPGVTPAVVVIDGIGQLRPTGTMLQVGTLGAFLLFAVVAALALVAAHRRGLLLAGGVLGLAVLAWGVIYVASRALLATTAIAFVAALALLARQRRPRSLVALPLAIVAAYGILAYQPFVGGPLREGNDSHFVRNQTYTYIDADGDVVVGSVSIGRGDPKAVPGYARRAAGGGEATTAADTSRGRFRDVLDELLAQPVIGHGTGTMTQSTQHLQLKRPETTHESEYVRVAHELGLPGLVLWVSFLLATLVAAIRAARSVDRRKYAAALAALGAAALVPLLTTLSFAFEYPVVGVLYHLLAGLALAWGSTRDAAGSPV